MRRIAQVCLVAFAATAFSQLAQASVMVAYPSAYDPMDETDPRPAPGEAAPGWGTSSWQGPATGKSNFHVRVDADGAYWNQILGATATVSQLQSLSYWTKSPTDNQDWWMTIYTAPETGDSGWYHSKIQGNYNHTANGNWNLWTTADNSLMFDGQSLADMITDHGSETIMSITLQTNSGWDGFDGYVDGLTISLTDGRVGMVDFAAVPEPTTLAIWGTLGGLGLIAVRRRRKQAA